MTGIHAVAGGNASAFLVGGVRVRRCDSTAVAASWIVCLARGRWSSPRACIFPEVG